MPMKKKACTKNSGKIDFDFCNISSSCDVQIKSNQKVLFKVGTFYNNQHKLSRAFQTDIVYKRRWLTQAGYWFIFDFVSILLVWVTKCKMPSNWKISVT